MPLAWRVRNLDMQIYILTFKHMVTLAFELEVVGLQEQIVANNTVTMVPQALRFLLLYRFFKFKFMVTLNLWPSDSKS